VSIAAITLCVASQRAVPNVSVHFVIDSVRKLLDTPSYISPYTAAVISSLSVSLLRFLSVTGVASVPFYGAVLV
jgi:hypothetical protein